MTWIRRHPVASAVFAALFVFFVFAAIVGGNEDDDASRSDAILGLVLIYLIIVGLYALGVWIYGKLFGRSQRDASLPVNTAPPPWTSQDAFANRPPVPAQRMFPQWDWSAPATVTCGRCGAANPPSAAFCDQCGARLAVTAPVAPPTGAIQCPRCQTLLSPKVRFCTNCGLPRQSV